MSDTAEDMFGRAVAVGDLVVYGHSGRYAATRVGRVYKIEDRTSVRVRLAEKVMEYVPNGAGIHRRSRWTGVWERGGHASPNGFVRIDDEGTRVPILEELL